LDILIPYIKENPNSEGGWFLLSFAIDGTQEKMECLKRALSINPNNTKAQARLTKIQSGLKLSSTQELTESEQTGETKKRNRKSRSVWIVVTISLLLITLIAYISWKEILPTFSREKNPEISEGDSIPITNTPLPSPTNTATKTPLPTTTPTIELPPSITPTEETVLPINEFQIPEGQLAQQMDDLQNQVSTIRGLGILIDSPRFIIPQHKVRKLVSEIFLERYTRDDISDKALVLIALGLIEPTYDLYTRIVTSIDEGLGGFYIPWTDELFIIGEEFTTLENFIFVHEYDHALVDQHYHLEDIGVYPECIFDNDRCLAISALIEGEATYLMYQWLEAYASESAIAEIETYKFTPIDKVISNNKLPPPYTIREIQFKYGDGKNFITHLFEQGGWEMVNSVYSKLPSSTEQILHPEKYQSSEKPIQIDLRPLNNLLGDDWRQLTTDTLGELTTEMILGSSANYLIQIDPLSAKNAAAGWGGDSYQVFYRSKSNHTILVVNWLWDSLEDQNEFTDAMATYLNKRYFGYTISDSEYNCWAKVNDHFSCLFTSNNNTLWITAPTWDEINLILGQYPQFK